MEPASRCETIIMSAPHQAIVTDQLKRKRSSSSSHEQQQQQQQQQHPVASAAPPAPKNPKTSNHLQINYLARQYNDDLPLISNDDSLPAIITLLGEYQGVLERHESMAGNLGARPLGPILIKRFERLFDSPPRVLKTHGKDGTTVTWLDVVEFARNKPEQFQLGQMSEGLRVCQFYTKQCRVQISEEDFILINSGIPQKMIPPQPIDEDEEKELETLEILEKSLASICQLADQVSARTRQLNHRLKGRKQAINDRRATNSPAAVPATAIRGTSPSNVALMNGAHMSSQPSSQAGGFVAVNTRSLDNGDHRPDKAASGNTSLKNELLSKFFTLSDPRAQQGGSRLGSLTSNGEHRRGSVAGVPSHRPSLPPKHHSAASHTSVEQFESAAPYHPTVSPGPAPMPHTPSSLQHSHVHQAHPPQATNAPVTNNISQPNTPNGQPRPTEKDDGGPYKVEMVAKMESLNKGERILPPCDRCRRLHMDCLKNLTACMGCTKKHAKCAWKEVREGELVVMRNSTTENYPSLQRHTTEEHYGTPLEGYRPAQPLEGHPDRMDVDVEPLSKAHNDDDEMVEAQLREVLHARPAAEARMHASHPAHNPGRQERSEMSSQEHSKPSTPSRAEEDREPSVPRAVQGSPITEQSSHSGHHPPHQSNLGAMVV